MKIYIAGCGGMLGKAFYNEFNKDFELKCTDKDVNETWLSYCDFRDVDEYKKDVIEFKPDYLFHLGALTDLEYCENNEQDCINSNYYSVLTGIDIAKHLNIPILYVSTAGIFDGGKSIYNENDSPNPVNNYGRSKYSGELAVQQSGLEYYICRAGWMMGGYEKDKKFIKLILNKIKEGNKELFVVNDKFGVPTYTNDFAKNVRLLLEKKEHGLYNMVCSGSTSRYEMAQEMVNILGLDIKVTGVPSSYYGVQFSSQRPESEVLVNQNLIDKGLNLMRDWKVSLKEYLAGFYDVR